MFKRILLIILTAGFLSGCSLAPKKAGVEIMSYPTAKVYIDNKEVGMTPYKNTTLKPKEVEIKLTYANQEWKRKVRLQNNTNTVINWQFDQETEEDGGYLLILEKTGDNKKAGLIVNSIPDKAAVNFEGEIKGLAPLKIEDMGNDDKQIIVSYPAYKSTNIFVRPIKGYQLLVEVDLIKDKLPEPEEITEFNVATESAIMANQKKVKILTTETGWLRVRETISNGEEIAKINPGEVFNLIDEKDGWVQIELKDGKKGWVSAKYVEKL